MNSQNNRDFPSLSLQTIQRMPSYLFYLHTLAEEGVQTTSAARAAEYLGLNEIQVRKDFSAVSSTPGKPKTGFSVSALINSMEEYLGFRNTKEAVLVGVGSLGRALLNYDGFHELGLHIVTAFDMSPQIIGETIHGTPVLSADKISTTCRNLNIPIGIITVPARQAQLVCDQLVAGGVKALWNFAPAHLSIPQGVLVQNENMAVSLALLSKHLEDTLDANKGGNL